MVEGDPTYAGPLAGIALGLSVFHVLEPDVKASIDTAVYDAQVGLMESALEAEQIIDAVRRVRESAERQ